MRDVYSLPKAHLHLHFEGSARPTTITEFAARSGIEHHVPTTFSGFMPFNDAYAAILEFITEPEDVVRIAREIVEDDATQGVRYLEPMFYPAFYADRFGMNETEVFDLIAGAFRSAGDEVGIEVNFLMAGIWTLPLEVTEASAAFAASQSDRGVVGFGLCGVEPLTGYEPWLRSCEIARDADLLVIPHAGEFGPAGNVAEAIELLSGHRVAHGVRAIEERSIVAKLADRQIVCDVAPTSNVVLGVFPELAAVPVDQFLEAGVPFTLNADDSLFFGSLVGEEYEVVRDTFGLSDDQLATIARTSINASGASAGVKARINAEIDAWLQSNQ